MKNPQPQNQNQPSNNGSDLQRFVCETVDQLVRATNQQGTSLDKNSITFNVGIAVNDSKSTKGGIDLKILKAGMNTSSGRQEIQQVQFTIKLPKDTRISKNVK